MSAEGPIFFCFRSGPGKGCYSPSPKEKAEMEAAHEARMKLLRNLSDRLSHARMRGDKAECFRLDKIQGAACRELMHADGDERVAWWILTTDKIPDGAEERKVAIRAVMKQRRDAKGKIIKMPGR